MSSSDDEVIWSKGDACLAPWSYDGKQLYSAYIRAFKTTGGRQRAVVSYDGYNSSNDEEIDLKQLHKVKKKKKDKGRTPSGKDEEEEKTQASMFSPLQGHEEKKRLQQRFSHYEEEDEKDGQQASPRWATTARKLLDPIGTPSTSSQSKRTKTQRKKASVAEGGQEIKSGSRSSSQSSSTGPVTPKAKRQAVHLSSSSDEEPDVKRQCKDGFSTEDLTKPCFRNPLHVEDKTAVPLVLSADHSVPAPVNRYLREYQREGVRFLYSQYAAGKGGILADDMGLGKTVQVISFISAVLKKTGTKEDIMRQRPRFIRQMSDNCHRYDEDEKRPGPFLIIGPASVLYNWVEELETWGHFTVGQYHKHFKTQTIADLKRRKLEVVVSTYETCRDNIKEINEFEWEAVIADEAHRIKGLKAEVTVALKSLKCQRRFGLTGTPLQNKLEELWCILDWAVPGHAGNLKTFQENFVKKIEHGQKADATKRELAEARKAQEKLNEMRQQHMLRRTKDIIAHQMPKKQELVVYCRPAPLQISLYQAVLEQEDMQHVLSQHNPCPCDSGVARGKCCYKKTPSGVPVKSLTFTFMNLLLKVSNHVALLLPSVQSASSSSSSQKATVQAAYAQKVCEEVFAAHPQFARLNREASFQTLSDPEYCGKMKLLTGMLKVFDKQKCKVLLFSYSVRLLTIIEQYVMSRGYEYRRLDGSTPNHRRLALVHEFNKDPAIFLFLASTKAAGVGLNLTGANVVVIFDPNWNPTHDLQAADRAYRLGQSRDVRVYRLVCSGTLEENVYLRQLYKQQLDSVAVDRGNARRYFHGVQGDKQHKGELFGLENMFKLRTGDRCMTEDIIKRNRQVEDALSTKFRVEEYVPPATVDSNEEEEEEDREEEDCPVAETISAGEDNDGDSSDGDDQQQQHDDDDDDEEEMDQSTSMSTKQDETPRRNKIPRKEEMDQRTTTFRKQDESPSIRRNKIPRKTDSDLDDIDAIFGLSSPKSEVQSDATVFKIPAVPSPNIPIKSPDKSPAKTNIKTSTRTPETFVAQDDLDIESFSVVEEKELVQKSRSPKSRSTKSRSHISSSPKSRSSETMPPQRKTVVKKKRILFTDCDDKELTKDKGKGIGKTSATKAGFSPIESMAFESVTDVFADCGVIHTHKNREVVGASKAEDHMSRCAVKDVYELNMFTQEPAVHCPDMEKSSEEESDDCASNKSSKKSRKKSMHKSSTKSTKSVTFSEPIKRAEQVGNMKVLIGQTPKGIRTSQFKEMADRLGFSNIEELATAVVQGNRTRHLEMLEEAYGQLDPSLRPLVQSLAIQEEVEEEEKKEEKGTKVKLEKGVKGPGRQKKPAVKMPPAKRPPQRRPKRRQRPVYSDMSDSDSGEETGSNWFNPFQKNSSDTEMTAQERIIQDKSTVGQNLDKKPHNPGNKDKRKEKKCDVNSKNKDGNNRDSKRTMDKTPKYNNKEHQSTSAKVSSTNQKCAERFVPVDSIDAMVNEMFSPSPKKSSEGTKQNENKTSGEKTASTKAQLVVSKESKEVAQKAKGKPTKDLNDTFAFLDSVFFD